MKKTIIMILILFFISNVQGKTGQKSFLWKVQSNKAIIYILGSVHVGKKDMYPLKPIIEKAFNQSNILVVEVNIESISMSKKLKLLADFSYSGDDVLKKHLSQKTYKQAKAKLSEYGITIELVKKYKPWLIASMIAVLELRKLGYSENYGIDRYFIRKAKDNMKIFDLETAEYQMSLFNDFSDEVQERFLFYTIQDLHTLKDMMNHLMKSWTEGDVKRFESAFIQSFDYPELLPVYEKLINERNINMTTKIEGFLKTKKRYFVVVGAGHLIGKKGIIELLRQKGYLVEQQ